MKDLERILRKFGRFMLVSGLASLLSLGGCTEITRAERVRKQESELQSEVKREHTNSYYINSLIRNPAEIKLRIMKVATEKEYTEIPFRVEVYKEKYEITRRPQEDPLFHLFVYPLLSISTFGALPIIDLGILCFKGPKSTIYYKRLTDEGRFVHTTERLISKEKVRDEISKRVSKPKIDYRTFPAGNIEVKVDVGDKSLNKKTDADGEATFEMDTENSGRITIKTLAKDGENETKMID